jgi:hypothetical protein
MNELSDPRLATKAEILLWFRTVVAGARLMDAVFPRGGNIAFGAGAEYQTKSEQDQ